MATATQKITLSSSRDIPFNKLVLSQSNVRRVKAGISVEKLAESIARRGLIQWGLSGSEDPSAPTRPGPGRPGHWRALWGKPAPPHQIGPERPF